MTPNDDARGAKLVTAGDTALRPATIDDAQTIAALIDLAGEGLPRRIWSHYAPQGVDPLDFGAERAAVGSGNFFWRNAYLLHSQLGSVPG